MEFLQVLLLETSQKTSYSKNGIPCWIMAYSRERPCRACPTQNIWWIDLKLLHCILKTITSPTQLVSLNLDMLWRSYDVFTRNTCFRIVLGLATYHLFHRVKLQKHNDPQDEIFITSTWICFLNNLHILQSESYKNFFLLWKWWDDL